MIENFGEEKVRGPLTPEKILMLKVARCAVDDYQHPKGTLRKRQRLRREALRWFLVDEVDDEGTRWPFSFTAICEVFDLDPQAIRDRLKIGKSG